MADNKVSVELTIEEQQALKSLSNLTRGLDEFAKKSQASTAKAESSFSSFGKTVAAVFTGNVIANFATDAIRSLGQIPGVLTDFVRAGIEADAVSQRLSFALALSGDASDKASKQLNGVIDSVSKLTGADDEAIASSAAFALSLGATEKQAEQILKTAADLSVALGVDFNTAVQQLSGTLEGSTGKLGKISSEIKKLDEDALRSGAAIDILAKRFSGLAEVNSGNAEVQIKNIGVAIGNLQEDFGKAVKDSPAFNAVLKTINQTLTVFSQELERNGPAIQEFTTSLVTGFVNSATATAALTDAIARIGIGLKNVVEVSIAAFITGITAIPAAIEKAANAVAGFLGVTSKFTFFEDVFASSVDGIKSDFDELTNTFSREAPVPGTQAIFDFADTYKRNLDGIDKATANSEAKRNELSARGREERRARQAQDLAEAQAFEDQLLLIKQQAIVQEQIGQAQLREQQLIFGAEEAELIRQLELTKLNIQFDAQRKKIEAQAAGTKRDQEIELNNANRKKAIQEFTTKSELDQQKIRNENLKSSLGSIATLTQSSNKELFAIGKAASIANATIDGIAAVQKALASAPPPFNFAIAALVGAAQAVNLQKIASAQPPSFAQGGIVPGSSFVGDQVSAQVNSGEMVLTRQQQANLFEQANNGGGGGGVVAAINALGDRIAAIQTQIIINGREIARVVRDEREAGFAV